MEPFELRTEVIRCRSLLEESADQHISMFCYPNGKYDSATLKSVREAGYLGARTTRMLRTDAGNDRFEIPTTVQAYPHPEVSYLKNAAKGRNYRSLLKHVLPVFTATSWIQLGMRMFDYVLAHGGVWHLYGHSWELEDYRLWNELRTLLDYVSGRDSVEYMTNGELTAFSHGRKPVALTPAA
jgi:hypothetical protein